MTTSTRRTLLIRLRHQALGLAFLVVVVLFFAVTIGMYNKVFTEVAMVRLETGHVGNQMREGADVKVRGMVVGEVRDISAHGDGATLELAMNPDRIGAIPADVSARLLPKTLFGERYVALVPKSGAPVSGSAVPRLRAGSVISQDRSSNAIELEQVFNNLMPLLQAVEPQKLSSTLNAVHTALDGNGEKLGQTLVEFSDYLGEVMPSLPDLKANLDAFDDVADAYTKATPDLLEAMSEFTTTTKTLVDKQSKLRTLYADVTMMSRDLGGFFRVNRVNLIRLPAETRAITELLAKYSPQYPCMLRQLAAQVPEAERAFGKGDPHPERSKVTIEIIASRGPYKPGVDEPRYDDKRGPRCYPVVARPDHWSQYPPGGPLDDGASKPPPPKEPDGHEADDYEDYGYSGSGGSAAGIPSLAHSRAEQQLISVLAAPAVGDDPANVPGWASLLVGPLYRGMEVEFR